MLFWYVACCFIAEACEFKKCVCDFWKWSFAAVGLSERLRGLGFPFHATPSDEYSRNVV